MLRGKILQESVITVILDPFQIWFRNFSYNRLKRKKPYISLIHKDFSSYYSLFFKASGAENET